MSGGFRIVSDTLVNNITGKQLTNRHEIFRVNGH